MDILDCNTLQLKYASHLFLIKLNNFALHLKHHWPLHECHKYSRTGCALNGCAMSLRYMENHSVALYAPFWEASLIREVESCMKKIEIGTVDKTLLYDYALKLHRTYYADNIYLFSLVPSMSTDLFPHIPSEWEKKWTVCFDISIIRLAKQSPSCTGLHQVLNDELTHLTGFVGVCAGEGNSKVLLKHLLCLIHLHKNLIADLLSTSLYHLWAAFVQLPGVCCFLLIMHPFSCLI